MQAETNSDFASRFFVQRSHFDNIRLAYFRSRKNTGKPIDPHDLLHEMNYGSLRSTNSVCASFFGPRRATTRPVAEIIAAATDRLLHPETSDCEATAHITWSIVRLLCSPWPFPIHAALTETHAVPPEHCFSEGRESTAGCFRL